MNAYDKKKKKREKDVPFPLGAWHMGHWSSQGAFIEGNMEDRTQSCA